MITIQIPGYTVNEQGEYERDGCVYGGIEGALHNEFGFCGCGDPTAAYLFIRDVLRMITNLYDDQDRPWNDLWEERQKREAVLFPDKRAAWVVYYLLDDKGMTEHGGCVPGWLTEKGRAMLAVLDAYAAAGAESLADQVKRWEAERGEHA